MTKRGTSGGSGVAGGGVAVTGVGVLGTAVGCVVADGSAGAMRDDAVGVTGVLPASARVGIALAVPAVALASPAVDDGAGEPPRAVGVATSARKHPVPIGTSTAIATTTRRARAVVRVRRETDGADDSAPSIPA
jgi:hypothetical protein